MEPPFMSGSPLCVHKSSMCRSWFWQRAPFVCFFVLVVVVLYRDVKYLICSDSFLSTSQYETFREAMNSWSQILSPRWVCNNSYYDPKNLGHSEPSPRQAPSSLPYHPNMSETRLPVPSQLSNQLAKVSHESLLFTHSIKTTCHPPWMSQVIGYRQRIVTQRNITPQNVMSWCYVISCNAISCNTSSHWIYFFSSKSHFCYDTVQSSQATHLS